MVAELRELSYIGEVRGHQYISAVGERRIKGALITSFKFLNHFDDVDTGSSSKDTRIEQLEVITRNLGKTC